MDDDGHVGGGVVEAVAVAVGDGAVVPEGEVAVADRLEDGCGAPAVEKGVVESGEGGLEVSLPVQGRGQKIPGSLQQRVLGRVIARYLQQSPELLRNLRISLAEQNADGVRRATHSLKSSSANLGARALAELCKELEHKGRGNNLEGMAALAGEVERQYRLVSRALTALAGDAGA